jgi:hypothetical protein
MARRSAMMACVLATVGALPAAGGDAPPPPPSAAITWDRPANIRSAAERIGQIQRRQGADAAIKFIDACYRTHGLASSYSEAFEACIAQDYLQTKLLTRIYGKLPPQSLKKLGAPTADALAQAMGKRIVAAFSQYKVTAAEAEVFKSEVDKHGLPVFLKTVFPNAGAEIEALEKRKETQPNAREKQ